MRPLLSVFFTGMLLWGPSAYAQVQSCSPVGCGEQSTSLYQASGNDIATTADAYCRFAITATLQSSTSGWIMTSDGSILGVAGVFAITGHSVTGSMGIEVHVNGSVVLATPGQSVAGDGQFEDSVHQSPGIDRFAAGDVISCFYNKDGTLDASIDWIETVIDISVDR